MFDLYGEPNWMHDMIVAHDAAAKASGARIVFFCGFDSIPFDLGVWTVQQAAKAKFGAPTPTRQRPRAQDAGHLRQRQGGRGEEPRRAAAAAQSIRAYPAFTGPDQPKGIMPEYNAAVGGWVVPFMMAAINTKNVHLTMMR